MREDTRTVESANPMASQEVKAMEKLSSVLPASPRVKSVDLKNAKPVRPGSPSYGAPIGSVSSDRLKISEAAKEAAFQETLAARNPREMSRAKMAEDVTRRFFENRLAQPESATLTRGEKEVLEPEEAPSANAPIKAGNLDVQA